MRTTGIFPVLILFLLINPAFQVISQEVIPLNGVVSDSVTGNGLPFAQVSIKNSTIGTVTNDEGQFRLKVRLRSFWGIP